MDRNLRACCLAICMDRADRLGSDMRGADGPDLVFVCVAWAYDLCGK